MPFIPMTRFCRLALGVLLTCASPAGGLAAEGFHTDKMPAAVRAIWPSVYAFVCEGNGSVYTASAFLVGKTDRGKTATYYFMTAGHAVEDCRAPRRYLAEDVSRARFESDGITLAAPPQRLEWREHRLRRRRLRSGRRQGRGERGTAHRQSAEGRRSVRQGRAAGGLCGRLSGRRQAPVAAPQSRGQALEQGELRRLRQGGVPRGRVSSISLRASIHFPAARAAPWWTRTAS